MRPTAASLCDPGPAVVDTPARVAPEHYGAASSLDFAGPRAALREPTERVSTS